MNNKLMRGMVHSALALSMAFVSQSSLAVPLNTAPTDIEFGIPVVIEPGNDLVEVNGPGDFGTDANIPADDGIYIDVSSVFDNGFNFYGLNHSAVNGFVFHTAGIVTLGAGSHPGLGEWVSGQPISSMFRNFFIHTGNTGDDKAPSGTSPGGNSTGTNKYYYHLDTVNNVVTLTFDDISCDGVCAANSGTAAQMRFHDIGAGNFVVEYRYENVGWALGENLGWTNGDGINFDAFTTTNFATNSNIGHPGVYAWMFFDGVYLPTGGRVLEDSINGTRIGALSTTDVDVDETFTYELLDNADGRFALVVESGVTFVVVADGGQRLDFDKNETHDIRVKVTDSANNTFEKTLTINLVERPTFEMSSDIRVPVDTSMNITIKTNVDQGSGIPTITATGLPDWMNFSDNGDGTVTLSGFPSFELTFRVTLTVTDGFGTVTVRTFNITVSENDGFTVNNSDDSGTSTTTTVEVTVEGEDGDAASFGWMLMLLAGGLVARRKMK